VDGTGAGVDVVSGAAGGSVVGAAGSDFVVLEARALSVGLERVYFVVMRVCYIVRSVGDSEAFGGNGSEILLTVVGLASRRRADWVSHACAVGR
jgi:hypothetical protein